jgi:hypothetical protein
MQGASDRCSVIKKISVGTTQEPFVIDYARIRDTSPARHSPGAQTLCRRSHWCFIFSPSTLEGQVKLFNCGGLFWSSPGLFGYLVIFVRMVLYER